VSDFGLGVLPLTELFEKLDRVTAHGACEFYQLDYVNPATSAFDIRYRGLLPPKALSEFSLLQSRC
jgi:hypothetical protein